MKDLRDLGFRGCGSSFRGDGSGVRVVWAPAPAVWGLGSRG